MCPILGEIREYVEFKYSLETVGTYMLTYTDQTFIFKKFISYSPQDLLLWLLILSVQFHETVSWYLPHPCALGNKIRGSCLVFCKSRNKSFYQLHHRLRVCLKNWSINVRKCIFEDLNSHLLTLTQLAEESTALTVCPFGQRVRRGGDYLSHSLTIAIHLSWHMLVLSVELDT